MFNTGFFVRNFNIIAFFTYGVIIIKLFRIIISSTLIASLILLSGCEKLIYPSETSHLSHNTSNPDLKLTLNGSTSMSKLCNALGETFMQEYPNITVEKSDTGSSAAIKAVVDGSSLIGNLSRYLKEDEINDSIVPITIALDGIAVIVNAKNKINDISSVTLRDIFTKKITNWSERGGENKIIHLIGRESSSGTRSGFEESLGLNSSYIKYDAEYPETGDIISKINNDENAIGYCSLFSVYGNIKALKINSIEINEENISNNSYPIKRPFIQIYNKKSNSNTIKLWFDFVKSEKGNLIIRKEKLVPIQIDFERSNSIE